MRNVISGKQVDYVDLAETRYDARDLLKVDPVRGTKTYMKMLPNGEIQITDVHPIGANLRHTDRLRSNGEVKPVIGNTQRHWAHVAEIPLPLFTLWRSVLGPPAHNQKAWAARLNDPDNKKFRLDTRRI